MARVFVCLSLASGSSLGRQAVSALCRSSSVCLSLNSWHLPNLLQRRSLRANSLFDAQGLHRADVCSPLPYSAAGSHHLPSSVPSPPPTPQQVPGPLPFFGGTIVFLPSKPGPNEPVILPSAIPTPTSTPPPATATQPSKAAATFPAQPSSALTPKAASRAALQLKCHARARIPTPHGPVFLHLYKSAQDAKEHLAIVYDPAQLEAGADEVRPEHIRSRSLDAVWREGETEMERLIRGAYVGRLDPVKGGKAAPAPTKAAAGAAASAKEASKVAVPLVRIHSECFTGETLGSMRCDCGEQLDESLRLIAHPPPPPSSTPTAPSSSSTPSSTPPPPPPAQGRGVIVYLRQEGRGIGLLSKLLAYNLQDLGHDTVEANLALGHGADERTWDIAAGILEDLGFGESEDAEGETEGEGVRLMTNNPGKVDGLRGEGIRVVERVPMVPRAWETYPYRRKAKKAGEKAMAGSSSQGKQQPLLSQVLASQIHPGVSRTDTQGELPVVNSAAVGSENGDVEGDNTDEDEDDRARREWEEALARRAGVGLLGGMETRSVELDRYLRTKIERMGHMLELPPAQRAAEGK